MKHPAHIEQIALEKETFIPKRPEHPFVLLFAAILGLLAEGFIFFLLLTGAISLLATAFYHAIVSLVYGAYLLVVYLFRWDLRMPFIVTGLVVFLGPFGALGGLLAQLLYTSYRIFTPTLEQTVEEFFPEDLDSDLSRFVYERISYGLDRFDPDKIPFSLRDIMAYGDTAQKKIAIERILRYFRPEFSDALLTGLADKSNAIRVLAATAVARIEQQYATRMHQFQKAVELHSGNQEYLLDLARETEWQSEIQVIDSAKREKLRGKAIEHFAELVKQNPKHVEGREALGRLYCRSGDFEKSIDALLPLLDRKKGVEDEVLKWYTESLFALKRYHKIREEVRNKKLKVFGDNPEHDLIVDNLILWKRGIPYENLQFRYEEGLKV